MVGGIGWEFFTQKKIVMSATIEPANAWLFFFCLLEL
jgi:hypothetical protein